MFGLSCKIAVAAGVLTILTVADTKSAWAVTSFSFKVDLTEVLGGPTPAVGDPFTGTFSFEETAGIVVDGTELFDLISFDFGFLGQSFDVGSDSRVAGLFGFPTVSFDVATNDILGIDFLSEPFLPGTSFSFVPENLVGTEQDSEFIFAAAGVSGSGSVSYAPVPEPATVAGLLALGASSLLARKRQA